MTASARQLSLFLQQNLVSEMLAGAYLKAEGSEKTQASYLSTLCNNLATVSQNEEIAYVLSGDDFDFNLIDPENPKLFAISNNFSKNSVYAPVIGMLMTISSRQFTMRNKVPFVYFLDEMTTVNIKNFETLPSVLREYLCAFVLLTQSGSKVENQYGRLDRSSVEANFGNQFFGRTKDVESLKYYPMMFGKEEKERRSRSAGKSGGSTNRSVTVSSQKEDIYQGKDFADLEPGEFIGSATRANVSYFKVKLAVYMNAQGYSALSVSYAYMINGMAGIYIGTGLVSFLKKISRRMSAAAAFFFAGMGILVLVTGRSLGTVFLSAGLMGLFDGYGTPSITGIYTNHQALARYDKAELLAVFNTVGSGIQIVCPILYNLLIRPDGGSRNLAVMGGAFLAVGAVFYMMLGKEGKCSEKNIHLQ